jgi:hypothetical protein
MEEFLSSLGPEVSSQLSTNLGIEENAVQQMLAPIILGFLTQKRDQGGAGSTGIASILDRDGDGSILDDVAEMFLQGSSGRSRTGGGGLLGGLL